MHTFELSGCSLSVNYTNNHSCHTFGLIMLSGFDVFIVFFFHYNVSLFLHARSPRYTHVCYVRKFFKSKLLNLKNVPDSTSRHGKHKCVPNTNMSLAAYIRTPFMLLKWSCVCDLVSVSVK